MRRLAPLILILWLAGCGVHWRPSTSDSDVAPVSKSALPEASAKAIALKAQAMADAERKVAAWIRTGAPKEYADIEDFGSPLRKATAEPAAIAVFYADLRSEQEKRLARDKDGNLDLVRDKDGNPDFEATARIYDETADGFERAAGKR